jgi:hypothetical protein
VLIAEPLVTVVFGQTTPGDEARTLRLSPKAGGAARATVKIKSVAEVTVMPVKRDGPILIAFFIGTSPSAYASDVTLMSAIRHHPFG